MLRNFRLKRSSNMSRGSREQPLLEEPVAQSPSLDHVPDHLHRNIELRAIIGRWFTAQVLSDLAEQPMRQRRSNTANLAG